MNMIRGYKAFNSDFRCSGFKYRVGQTYKLNSTPIMCERGFHFCQQPVFVANYYDWLTDRNMRFAEVEASGETLTEGDKSVTDRIRIVREIPRKEFERICTGMFPLGVAEYHFRNGLMHRDDGPAHIWRGGSRWYQNGKFHRDGGPAVELSNGTRYWYQHGKLHRDDGPAVENKLGYDYIFRHGVIQPNGSPPLFMLISDD